ncbi:TPA: transposase, partial [Escherichia coli]|nr:transposase [Escherichia coli]
MFTEEEKIRAIELYFKYGKKLPPVVRELGYPSKRNLRRWIRSWETGSGAKESIRHKPRYSDMQKQVAVEHYLNHDRCLAFTSKTNPDAPFEPEVKRQAVMELCTRRVSASEVARRIGVSRAVLSEV